MNGDVIKRLELRQVIRHHLRNGGTHDQVVDLISAFDGERDGLTPAEVRDYLTQYREAGCVEESVAA